jgi:glucose/arabinose dehydrogenase
MEAVNIRSSVCSNSERGLLGIAVDPNFEDDGHVYLYYTYKKYGACPEKEPQQNNNPVNRVTRFVMEGNTISPNPSPGPQDGSGEVLIDNIPSPNGNHNAGDLHFGKDGKLYVSTGDGACDYNAPTRCQPETTASRDRNVLLGKVLLTNSDSTIPVDNPFAATSNGVRCGTLTNNNARGGSAAPPGTLCKETYSWGFRNPFRFAMDPDAEETSFRVNDVGGDT